MDSLNEKALKAIKALRDFLSKELASPSKAISVFREIGRATPKQIDRLDRDRRFMLSVLVGYGFSYSEPGLIQKFLEEVDEDSCNIPDKVKRFLGAIKKKAMIQIKLDEFSREIAMRFWLAANWDEEEPPNLPQRLIRALEGLKEIAGMDSLRDPLNRSLRNLAGVILQAAAEEDERERFLELAEEGAEGDFERWAERAARICNERVTEKPPDREREVTDEEVKELFD